MGSFNTDTTCLCQLHSLAKTLILESPTSLQWIVTASNTWAIGLHEAMITSVLVLHVTLGENLQADINFYARIFQC